MTRKLPANPDDRPIFRRDRDDRRAAIADVAGLAGTVYVDAFRDGERIRDYSGTIVGVASADNGTASDQVIIRLRAGWTVDGLALVTLGIASIAGILLADGRRIGRIPAGAATAQLNAEELNAAALEQQADR